MGGTKEREIDIRIVAATHRNLEKEVEAAGAPHRSPELEPEATPGGASADSEPLRRLPLSEELHAIEREAMAKALRETGGVKVRAAEMLAMPLRTFTFKCKQYGL